MKMLLQKGPQIHKFRAHVDHAAALDCPISYDSAAEILREVATLTPAYFEISHDRLMVFDFLFR